MNVVNTQLPQLYYNYNECFSLFSTYCILQCKYFWGDNQHVVIFGGHVPLVPHRFLRHCIQINDMDLSPLNHKLALTVQGLKITLYSLLIKLSNIRCQKRIN